MKKRLIATLLALCMVLGVLPSKAYATENGTSSIEPTVTKLTVTYKDGESYKTTSLLPLTSTLLQINMPADGKLTFEAKFDNSEILEKVYITSSRGIEVKRLQAYYDPNTGTYITDAEEHFDANDPSYIPGEIGVEYTKKQVAVTESGIVGDTELATLSNLLQGKGFKLADLVSKDDSVTANLFLNEVDQGLSMLFSELKSSAGIDNAEVEKWAGIYSKLGEIISYDLEGTDGKEYTVFLDYDENEAFLILLRDITENKYTKFLIQKTDNTFNLDDISDALSAVNTSATVLYDYYGISKEMNDLRREVENSTTMTVSEREEANKKIDALEKDKKWFMVGTTFIPLLLGSAAAVGTGGASLLFSALVGSITVASDYFWEHRIGMIQGCDPIDRIFAVEDGHGAGWIPLTKTYLEENEGVISKSGKYYLLEDCGLTALNISKPDDSEPPVDVTLCVHGKKSWCPQVYNGSTLRICDCTYKEHDDGTVSGGVLDCIIVQEKSKVIVDSGIVNNHTGSRAIINDSGEIVVNGGTIDSRHIGISSKNSGKITINGGSIGSIGWAYYGIEAESGNEIIINGGTIEGGRASIWIDSGKVTINGGKVSGGTEIIGYGRYNTTYDYQYGITSDVITTVTGGTHKGTIAINDGTVLVSGGKIFGSLRNAAGTVTVSGGEISNISDTISNLSENGTVNISGGMIISTNNSAIENTGGAIYISGGNIFGAKGNRTAITNTRGGQVTISNGTVSGGSCISNSYGAETTLLIGAKSDITFDGEMYAVMSSATTIKAAANYNGGITYYDSPDTVGVKKSIAELNNLDWLRLSYIRLVATKADISNPVNCEHEYKSSTTMPTCTNRGYTTYTCSKCGHDYVDNYADALGHDYGEWITLEEPTSTTPGQKERVCSRCDYKETEVIPATGSSAECEHSYDSNVTVPTCTEQGYTTYICNKCGNSYINDYVDALGHDYGEWIIVEEPTSTTPGQKERICSRCDYKEAEVIPATGSSTECEHSYDSNVAAPTCTEQGYTTYICSKCGNSYTDNYINALGHSYGEWRIVISTTATTDGLLERFCVRCNDRQTQTIPAIGESTYPSAPNYGSGSNSNVRHYSVSTPTRPMGGDVKLSSTNASVGSQVTVTAIPDSGYELVSLTVTDSKGNELTLTDKGNGKYVFVTPASAVTVNAIFEKIAPPPVETPVENTTVDETYLFPFGDIMKTDWFSDAVWYVFSNDLMSGTAPYTFNPQGKMNRAMVWTVLGRMADADVDDSDSAWYSKAQKWAITNNVSDGTNPTNSISRQELMTMLWRYMGSPAATADVSKFSDNGSVAGWADAAMQWAVSTGLIVGDNGRLNPTGDARRCEVAMIFTRFCKSIAE